MSNTIKNPFEIVASVLKIPVESITEESGWGKDVGWESLNHLRIINELEKEYELEISENDIEKYGDMKAIIELYETSRNKN